MNHSQLAGDLLNIVPTLLSFVGGVIAIYLFIMFLPLLVKLMLNIIISMVYSQLRFNIRPILDLIFFPGSMLRSTFMWFVMRMYGFSFRMGFYMPDFGESTSNINDRFLGLKYIAYQDNDARKKHSQIKMAFILSIASYFGLVVFLILLFFNGPIVTGMYFILPSTMVLPIYNFMLISIGLGGMPVPEETLAVLYAVLYTNPHIILNTFINIIATLILAPYVGPVIAVMVFVGVTVLTFITVTGMDPQKLEDDDFMEIFHIGMSAGEY